MPVVNLISLTTILLRQRATATKIGLALLWVVVGLVLSAALRYSTLILLILLILLMGLMGLILLRVLNRLLAGPSSGP
ncbi:hypothetical protein [Erwinia aphidicola]|uniref:hypothetical protein n=1 Tax=Erwinia aphidicola TaxID=68334 RepID=UPI0030CEDA6F